MFAQFALVRQTFKARIIYPNYIMTMTTTSHYIENFPFPTPRPVQVDILKEIESAFASGYRDIILECPTGSGKSGIAIAAAMTLGSSYISVGSSPNIREISVGLCQ